ncbi:hypothetical protein FEE59_13510 [Herbaspirillum sp. RU 5E]|nr:hypothetical protein [Herbaspirillum sp. RU 5E]
MSTDRELLEMAAKAAGIDMSGTLYSDGTWEPGISCSFKPASGIGGGIDVASWNPLKDDGDAFRLLRQVDYGLLVEDGVVKIMNNLGGCVLFLEIQDADEMTVIRRAITMAAAAAWRPGENDVPN